MPRPGTPLVHPDLLASLDQAGFYPSTVTIQQAAATQSGTGQTNPAWSNLAGHADLDARIAPIGAPQRGGDEIHRADGTIVVEPRRIALTGNYPAITHEHRAVDDAGTVWDILTVDHDDQTRSTYLTVERVT